MSAANFGHSKPLLAGDGLNPAADQYFGQVGASPIVQTLGRQKSKGRKNA